MTDHRVLLKNLPQLRLPAAGATSSAAPQNLDGKWDNQGGKYQLSMSGGQQEFTATIEGDRLTINTGEGMNLFFDRED